MAGYSDTPLDKKLGISSDGSNGVLHAPDSYRSLLPDYYPSLHTILKGEFDWLHAFYTQKEELSKEFPKLKSHLSPAGQLWISWPKKSAGIATDLSENTIRDIGLANGLVDVKVAAIDESWSGLKFVYRLEDRH